MTISNHIYFRLDIKIFRIFLFEPCHYLLSYIYVKRYLLFFVYIKHAMIKITIWLIYSQSHIFFDILIVELFFTMEMNTYIKKEIKMWTWEISFLIFHKELGLKPDQTITNIQRKRIYWNRKWTHTFFMDAKTSTSFMPWGQ